MVGVDFLCFTAFRVSAMDNFTASVGFTIHSFTVFNGVCHGQFDCFCGVYHRQLYWLSLEGLPRAILLPLEGLPWTILATSSRSALDKFSYLQKVCHDSFTQLLASLPHFPIHFEAENLNVIKGFCSASTGSLKHLNCIVFCIYWKIRLLWLSTSCRLFLGGVTDWVPCWLWILISFLCSRNW